MNQCDMFPADSAGAYFPRITLIKTQITQIGFNNNFHTLETMNNIKIFYEMIIDLKDFNLLTFYHTY